MRMSRPRGQEATNVVVSFRARAAHALSAGQCGDHVVGVRTPGPSRPLTLTPANGALHVRRRSAVRSHGGAVLPSRPLCEISGGVHISHSTGGASDRSQADRRRATHRVRTQRSTKGTQRRRSGAWASGARVITAQHGVPDRSRGDRRRATRRACPQRSTEGTQHAEAVRGPPARTRWPGAPKSSSSRSSAPRTPTLPGAPDAVGGDERNSATTRGGHRIRDLHCREGGVRAKRLVGDEADAGLYMKRVAAG